LIVEIREVEKAWRSRERSKFQKRRGNRDT
jgi:hypothetical protein